MYLSSQIIGVIAVIIGFAGYAPYLLNTFRGQTKPHFFSWLIWAALELISFGIQIKNGAGAGAWVTLFSGFIAFVIAVWALKYRQINITRVDWVCLIGAGISLVLWLGFNNPVLASIFLALTDFFAFIPTYRKSWQFPHEETLFEYGMSSLKWVVAFFAFSHFTLANMIYPAYLALANGAFVVYALIRRRALRNQPVT